MEILENVDGTWSSEVLGKMPEDVLSVDFTGNRSTAEQNWERNSRNAKGSGIGILDRIRNVKRTKPTVSINRMNNRNSAENTAIVERAFLNLPFEHKNFSSMRYLANNETISLDDKIDIFLRHMPFDVYESVPYVKAFRREIIDFARKNLDSSAKYKIIGHINQKLKEDEIYQYIKRTYRELEDLDIEGEGLRATHYREDNGIVERIRTIYAHILNNITNPLFDRNKNQISSLNFYGSKFFGERFKGVYGLNNIPVLDASTPYCIINIGSNNLSDDLWVAVTWSQDGTISNRHLVTGYDSGAQCIAWLCICDKWGVEMAQFV